MGWKDSDFATIHAFIRDVKCLLREMPEKAAELAPVLLEDAERAYQATIAIGDAVGAIK